MDVFQIYGLTGGKLVGAAETEVSSVASLQAARAGDVSFVEKWDESIATEASCLIVPASAEADIDTERFPHTSFIFVAQPKLGFAKAAAELYPAKRGELEVHQTAIIHASAKLGAETSIGAFVVVGENSQVGDRTQIGAGAKIGDDVEIGRDCTIHPNVCIENGIIIGDNVILHSGVCIGADGFGYVRDDERGYVKFPQIGGVVIEDDVEIGANTCIDRGSLGVTRIGAGTKIDNLVQIAHNVQIGQRVIIAAQTGISGSTIIEDDCVIGGQVGMGDHAKVLSGAIIGSQAGVLPGKIVRAGVWWGTPVQPLDEYKRQNALVKGLSRLKEQVKQLARQVKIDK